MLDKSIRALLNKEFPKGWELTSNKVAELSYSVLKSEGLLRICQAVHCDSKKAYAYSKAKAGTKFAFSLIVGIEGHSFLDFVNEGAVHGLWRVCMQKGDVLMLRGDMLHCAVENVVDHEHYRLHVYCDPVGIKAEDKLGRIQLLHIHLVTNILVVMFTVFPVEVGYNHFQVINIVVHCLSGCTTKKSRVSVQDFFCTLREYNT